MRQKLTSDIFSNTKIPEFNKIKKDYIPSYWIKIANKLIDFSIARYRKSTFWPRDTSQELINYICLNSGIYL